MGTPINIAALPIAIHVQQHTLMNFYASLLDALQKEAKRLGYFFARAHFAAPMPAVLADCLTKALLLAHEQSLRPGNPSLWLKHVNDAMQDGRGPKCLQDLLAALTACGIRLQKGPLARFLLTSEIYFRQEREKDAAEKAIALVEGCMCLEATADPSTTTTSISDQS